MENESAGMDGEIESDERAVCIGDSSQENSLLRADQFCYCVCTITSMNLLFQKSFLHQKFYRSFPFVNIGSYLANSMDK